MDYKPIEFRQLCAVVRAVIQRDPTIDDAEWKARTSDILQKMGFAEPEDHGMIARAMTQVEFAVRKTLGPRPVPLKATPEEPTKPEPPRFEGRTNRPAGWDLVQKLMANLQDLAASVPSSGPPPPREILPITEEIAINEFWRQSRGGCDRLALLRAYAELAIIRSVGWNPKEIRAQAGDNLLSRAECFACGASRECHLHHVIQIQHGGSNYLRNRVPLCELCHHAVHPWLGEAPRKLAGWSHITGSIPIPGEKAKERA